MEECELCGRKTDVVYIAEVEGVEFRLCASCAKGKKVLRTEKTEEKASKNFKKAAVRPQEVKISREDMELVDNYSAIIKHAREEMKLPIPVLAEMISEKEHLLMKIEEGKAVPPLKLIDKLEKTLRIKLLKPPEKSERLNIKSPNEDITIGDIASDKLK